LKRARSGIDCKFRDSVGDVEDTRLALEPFGRADEVGGFLNNKGYVGLEGFGG